MPQDFGQCIPAEEDPLLLLSAEIRDKKQRCSLFNRLASITLGRNKPLANRAANVNLLIYLAIISHSNFSPSRGKNTEPSFPVTGINVAWIQDVDMQLFEFTADSDRPANPRSIESAFSIPSEIEDDKWTRKRLPGAGAIPASPTGPAAAWPVLRSLFRVAWQA